jgi:PAS domain S-box-containing protein
MNNGHALQLGVCSEPFVAGRDCRIAAVWPKVGTRSSSMHHEEARRWCRFENEDLACALRLRTAGWLRTVLRASALVLAAATLAGVAVRASPVWWIHGAFATVLGVSLVLDAMKRTREASVVLTVGFWMAATAAVAVLGGAHSPGVFVYLPIVVTAGLFWSWRAAALLAAASFGSVMLAAWLDAIHQLPRPIHPISAARIVPIFAGSLTMTAVLVGVAIHTLHSMLKDAQRSAIRIEELLLQAPDALVVFDRLGVVLAVSPSMRERMGYGPTDLVGKHSSRLDLFNRDGRSVADDLRLLGARDAEGAREFALTRSDGTPAWGEARLHTVAMGKGDPVRRIVLYDVTRRHVVEARHADIEARVVRGRRLEAMGLLAGGVAHDINNLLTVILSLGAVLNRETAPDSPARELLVDINASAVRAAALVRELLAAKSSGNEPFIDIGRALDAFEPVLMRMLGEGNVDLSLRLPDRPCLVKMERGGLERIVTNLVVNARDAMPDGGSIVVAVAPASDVDGTLPIPGMIELSVSDTGMGIDPTMHARIFEPFFTSKGAAGTGLGLAAVDDIVTRLGGSILVDSQRGGGTKFRILLPQAATEDVSS